MRKKLQIYISSTYYDLIDERHTAVEAVLQAGHIPAGIEQFFKESPMNMRKRWIDDSDVYILILGGFYGLTLPDDETKSYTHWEYEYAGEAGKPRFAFVVTDEALRQKPYDFSAIEYYQQFQEFKQSVMEQIPIYYVEDVQHIKKNGTSRSIAKICSKRRFIGLGFRQGYPGHSKAVGGECKIKSRIGVKEMNEGLV